MTTTNGTNEFYVLPATEADIPDILRLIRELAEYERALHEVHATEALLKESIFEKGYARCLIARDGKQPQGPATDGRGEAIGMALYFFNFSTWLGVPGLYLEDLYVTPSRRNAGIGKVLFGHLGRIAREHKCGRMEWKVIKWNAPSIAFYEKVLGAHEQSEWEGMRLEGEAEIGRLEKYLEGRE